MTFKHHTKKTVMSLAIASCFAVALTGCNGGGGGSDSSTSTSATETACVDLLTKFSMDGVTLTEATLVDATTDFTGVSTTGGAEHTGPLPAHCVVRGYADSRTSDVDGKSYKIGFEVRMPTTGWNNRFFFQGGGGSNGALATAYGNLRGNILNTSGIPEDNALNRGFVVASTDGGHLTESGSNANAGTAFGADPQARLDYGYNAVARTTDIAKALIAKRYGTTAAHSYFVGCSNGGRDAMVASQRLPEQFDGVFAMNPGFQLPKAAVNQMWDIQQFNRISSTIYDSFSQADLNAVSTAVLNACDSLDGATDGLILNQTACQATFDPDTALAGVLTATQIDVLKKVIGGVKDADGHDFYADFPWDAGFNYKDWRSWKLGRAAANGGIAGGASQALSLGTYSLAAVFMSPYDTYAITGDTAASATNALAFALNIKSSQNTSGTVDPEAIYATSGVYSVPSFSKTRGEGFMSGNSLNYDIFKSQGHKLIVAHGTSDGVFSSNDTKNWYEALMGKYGSSSTKTFARFFQIPGMNHCSGGPSTDKFDMVTALVNWVENGTAPESVSASTRDQSYAYTGAYATTYKPTLISAGITRPLCAYPKQAHSSDNGATWVCQ